MICVALVDAFPTESDARKEPGSPISSRAEYLGIWHMPTPERPKVHVFAEGGDTASDLIQGGFRRPASEERAVANGGVIREPMTDAEYREWQRTYPHRLAERVKVAKVERALERGTASVELTLEAMITKLGWSKEYAEHFVQPYCKCGDGHDGWEICAHANDLGLGPWK